MPKSIDIYTDGACSGNPGPGGYGAVLLYKTAKKEINGGFTLTTNNRMELLAAITALELLKEPCEINLYSDSRYLVDGITKGWALRWRQNGWMRNNKEKALNSDLWERLLTLLSQHSARLIWVKGHASNELNNRCDELARAAIENADKQADAGFLQNQ
ncbi:MAG: ribonuclease HI [Defluviitaleaceae bacterium]|nr:ribonuclease HI [Defluviitaleaceae bacterium]MCL2836007.1 ribonuclease HI [Defluviitaleaceae bacterium]